MDPKASAVYSWAVGVVGGVLLVFAVFTSPGDLVFLREPTFLLLFVLEIALTAAAIPVGKFHVSLDFSIVLATYMVYDLLAAGFINLAVIPVLIFRKRPARIIAMDVGALVSAVVAGGFFSSRISGLERAMVAYRLTPSFVNKVLVFTAVTYLVNTGLMVAYALMSTKVPQERKKREIVEISTLNAVCTALGALLGVVIVLNVSSWGDLELYLFSVALMGLIFLSAILGRTARTHADLVRLYEASAGINAATRLEDVFEKACHASSQLDRWDFWWLTICDPAGEARLVKTKLTPGLPEKDVLEWVQKIQIWRAAAGTGTIFYWNRERFPSDSPPVFGSALFMRLRRGSRYVGEFGMARVPADQIEGDLLRLYALLSAQVSLAVDNANQWETLTELAARDPLTGLYNYREFCSRLVWAVERARTTSSKVSLIFIDLDHFRRVNNLHGHVVGDEALKEIATSIKRTVRDSDYPCRYGGDEFTIILPATGKEGARKVAERIVRNIAETGISFRGESLDLSGVVSASWGVATFPEDGETPEELVNKADADMYSVKRELEESSEKE